MTAAGIVENYSAQEYPTEKIRKLLDINVMGRLLLSIRTIADSAPLGSWFCALQAQKRMAEGGSIILIGSMSGSASHPDSSDEVTRSMVSSLMLVVDDRL